MTCPCCLNFLGILLEKINEPSDVATGSTSIPPQSHLSKSVSPNMLHFLYFSLPFRLQVFFSVCFISYLFICCGLNTDVGQCKTSISTRVLWSPAALCLDACLSWSDCNRTTINPYIQVIIWWICVLFSNKSSKLIRIFDICYLIDYFYCSLDCVN